MSKFYKPEDYYGYEAVKAGRAERLPDSTVKRMDAMIKSVKTKADLDAIRRVLPKEQANYIAKQVLNANKGKATSRVGSAKNAVLSAPNLTPHGIARTVTNIADVITGPEVDPQVLELLEAAKAPPPQLTNYEVPKSNLVKTGEKFGRKITNQPKNP